MIAGSGDAHATGADQSNIIASALADNGTHNAFVTGDTKITAVDGATETQGETFILSS